MDIIIKNCNIKNVSDIVNTLKPKGVNVTIDYRSKQNISDENRQKRFDFILSELSIAISKYGEIRQKVLWRIINKNLNVGYKTFQRDIDFLWAEGKLDKEVVNGSGSSNGKHTMIKGVKNGC